MVKNIKWQAQVIPRVQSLLLQYPYAPTVRAMFYRLVSDTIIPNTYGMYKGLIQALNTAREKEPDEPRYISVYSFADDTRYTEDIDDGFWSMEDYVDSVLDNVSNAGKYYFQKGYLTRWHNQPNYVEVMIEKNALRGAFKHVLGSRSVRIVPNNGWASKIYRQMTIDRLLHYKHGHNGEGPKEVYVLYFGDYDPSGLRMSQNIGRNLSTFGINFVRIGLTHNQISEFGLDELRNPDPEVMKKLERDPNADSFRWENNRELFQIELDALQKSPEQFKEMVLASVDKYYDGKINEQNLREVTPRKIDTLIQKRVKFLDE